MTDERSQPESELADTDPADASAPDLATDVHFPPVVNGLDYLTSVVEHLARGSWMEPRDVKYAVVHLQAAVECLLKYRLELEHWSLVFSSPGDAVRSRLDDGSLNTCTVDQTISRLINIAGVTISPKESTSLKNLARLRNQLQHYGRPHSPMVNRYTIEANAAEVLEFLIHFLDEELLGRLPEEELATAAETLEPIRAGLGEIRGFVVARWHRIAHKVAPRRHHTIQCPHCTQFALVVENNATRCLFCDNPGNPEYYAAEVLGRNWQSAAQGGPDPVEWCLICEDQALVRGATLADDSDFLVDLCFSCGEIRRAPAVVALLGK